MVVKTLDKRRKIYFALPEDPQTTYILRNLIVVTLFYNVVSLAMGFGKILNDLFISVCEKVARYPANR